VRRVERFSKASFIALSIGTKKRKDKLQKRKALDASSPLDKLGISP
jgi:hypothetical protein